MVSYVLKKLIIITLSNKCSQKINWRYRCDLSAIWKIIFLQTHVEHIASVYENSRSQFFPGANPT